MRIWITRAQPEAEATARRLKAFGHEPVIAPLLQVQPVGEASELGGVGALAFTSRNGVRAFAAFSAERGLPVFAVGDATAEAARDVGFADVVSASGDVEALAELIAARKASFDGQLLYLSPEETAGDLADALERRGVLARTQVIYRTVAAELSAGPPTDIDAVLIHSAKAARRLAGEPALRTSAVSLTAVCISTAAAAPLQGQGFREVLVATAPNETALLQILDAWAVRQAPRRMFTPLFWIVIAFGLACIIGAIGVVSLGPRLFPLRRDGTTPAHGAAASNPQEFRLRPPSPSGPP